MAAAIRQILASAVVLALAVTVLVPPASALTLEECRRITFIHGGEAAHRDLGEGRVLWLEWWSLEGTAHWIHIADCDTGAALKTLTRSEQMRERLPFNRTERAAKRLETILASPILSGFDQIEAEMATLNLTSERRTLETEPCACAALYPGLRGDRPEFVMESL